MYSRGKRRVVQLYLSVSPGSDRGANVNRNETTATLFVKMMSAYKVTRCLTVIPAQRTFSFLLSHCLRILVSDSLLVFLQVNIAGCCSKAIVSDDIVSMCTSSNGSE